MFGKLAGWRSGWHQLRLQARREQLTKRTPQAFNRQSAKHTASCTREPSDLSVSVSRTVSGLPIAEGRAERRRGGGRDATGRTKAHLIARECGSGGRGGADLRVEGRGARVGARLAARGAAAEARAARPVDRRAHRHGRHALQAADDAVTRVHEQQRWRLRGRRARLHLESARCRARVRRRVHVQLLLHLEAPHVLLDRRERRRVRRQQEPSRRRHDRRAHVGRERRRRELKCAARRAGERVDAVDGGGGHKGQLHGLQCGKLRDELLLLLRLCRGLLGT